MASTPTLNDQDDRGCDLLPGAVSSAYFDFLVKRARLRSYPIISALEDHLVRGMKQEKVSRFNGVSQKTFNARLASLKTIHNEWLRDATPSGNWIVDTRSKRMILGFSHEEGARQGTYRKFTETKRHSFNEAGTWQANLCRLTLRVTAVEGGDKSKRASTVGDAVSYDVTYIKNALRLKGGGDDFTLRAALLEFDVDSFEPPKPRRFPRTQRKPKKRARKREREKMSVSDTLGITGCVILPALVLFISIIRAIYLCIFVEGSVEHLLRYAGGGAALGLGLAVLGMFMTQTDTYQRTVNLRTGETTPWKLVSSVVDGPFGEFVGLTAMGAIIGLLIGIWI